jgi:hypothetical protein
MAAHVNFIMIYHNEMNFAKEIGIVGSSIENVPFLRQWKNPFTYQ